MELTRTHIILFFLTLLTTFFAGYIQGGNFVSGISFSFSILFILGSHEMGHYLYGKKYGVLISPPYFIPVPPPFIAGTMGAFIKIKSQITSKRALFDIGVAGPIYGIIATVPVLFIGLKLSHIVPITDFEDGTAIKLGSSLIFNLFVKLIHGNIQEGYDLFLHPVAFAGWIGLFVTALNLIPSGQLDGGHLIYSLFSKKIHSVVSHISIVLLILFGVGTKPFVELLSTLNIDMSGVNSGFIFEGWLGWLIWAFLLTLLGTKHPPTIYEENDIGTKRKIVAGLTLLLFIVCFMPFPFSLN
ncbi:MAG: site-2 protease family protein [Thermodesulfobacteriota bacterium]